MKAARAGGGCNWPGGRSPGHCLVDLLAVGEEVRQRHSEYLGGKPASTVLLLHDCIQLKCTQPWAGAYLGKPNSAGVPAAADGGSSA